MKKMKMILILAGVLILAGCGNKAVNNSETGSVGEPEQTRMENKLEINNEAGGIISSIKDAMGLGKEMKCTYKMKVGNETIETVSYVNGKKYMTETMVAGIKQKMIFDEEAMYSWSEKDKKGMKFTMACMKEFENSVPKTENSDVTENVPDPTGEKTFENAMDVKCEPASGADFSIPSDVVFSDQCEMMKSLTRNMPANIPGMPSNLKGMPAPGSMPEGVPGNMPQGVPMP